MQGKVEMNFKNIGDVTEIYINTDVEIDSVIDDCVSKIIMIRELMRAMHFTVLETELLKLSLVGNVWPDNSTFIPENEPEMDRAIQEAIMGGPECVQN